MANPQTGTTSGDDRWSRMLASPYPTVAVILLGSMLSIAGRFWPLLPPDAFGTVGEWAAASATISAVAFASKQVAVSRQSHREQLEAQQHQFLAERAAAAERLEREQQILAEQRHLEIKGDFLMQLGSFVASELSQERQILLAEREASTLGRSSEAHKLRLGESLARLDRAASQRCRWLVDRVGDPELLETYFSYVRSLSALRASPRPASLTDPDADRLLAAENSAFVAFERAVEAAIKSLGS